METIWRWYTGGVCADYVGVESVLGATRPSTKTVQSKAPDVIKSAPSFFLLLFVSCSFNCQLDNFQNGKLIRVGAVQVNELPVQWIAFFTAKNKGNHNAQIFSRRYEPLFAPRFFGCFSCFQLNAKMISYTAFECTQRKKNKGQRRRPHQRACVRKRLTANRFTQCARRFEMITIRPLRVRR